MRRMRIIDDDAVVAMITVGAISIVALILMRADAKDIVLMSVGGILALARGKLPDKKEGLPGNY